METFNDEQSELKEIALGLSVPDFLTLSFNNVDIASRFFYFYAAVTGFNLRKHDQRRRRSGEIVMHKWVCSRQGLTPVTAAEDGRVKSRRGTSRVGCSVCFKINKVDLRSWDVTSAILDHNHDCIPTKQSCFMKMNRFLTEGNVVAVKSMLSAGIRKCDIMRYFAEICGGNSKVGFTQGDLYNHFNTERRAVRETSDLDAVLSYLSAKKSQDHGMTLTTYVQDGVVRRCYWADSRSRLDFMCFGDVVALDSTFKTNSYNMMMIVIVGVNHHHQTVVFGAGLLQIESTDDYSWLLENHTAAMCGKKPISIVTDSDKAIRAAVRRCWPDVKHRLCMWHLQRNMSKHARRKEIFRKLNEFVYRNDCAENMEEEWAKFIELEHLQDNRWYRELYQCRHMWWEAYLRGTFWGELRSTQRCERMHAYMKGYVKTSHKLHEFLHHYDRAVSDLRHKELQADYENGQRKPTITTVLTNFEEHAATIFTMKSFQRVQQQVRLEALYYVSACNTVMVDRTYDIVEYDNPGGAIQVFTIVGTGEFTCSCLHYETQGFPCAHTLHVAKVEGYRQIPDKLILKRWTRNAKSRYSFQEDDFTAYGEATEDARQGALVTACSSMCYFGSRSREAFQKASRVITELTQELQLMTTGNDAADEEHTTNTHKRKHKAILANVPYRHFSFKHDVDESDGGNVAETTDDDSKCNESVEGSNSKYGRLIS